MAGFVREIASRYGPREALCWRDQQGHKQSWSYAELFQESQRVARALLASGIGKDARVGVLISNRPEWLFSMFGISLAGAVTVALNTFSTRNELESQLALADVEFLILENEVASHNFLHDLSEICPELIDARPGQVYCKQLPYLRRVVSLYECKQLKAVQNWPEFLAQAESIDASLVEKTADAVNPVDCGFIFFSSGSTSQPKAIRQTHRSAALQSWRCGNIWYQLDKDVRTWSANGFFWSGNFVLGMGSTLGVGGCLILQRYFIPEQTLELIEQEQVTLPVCWPHQEARLRECSNWASVNLSSIYYVDKNSALLSHPTITSNWRGPQGYGLTETFTFITARPAGDKEGIGHGNVMPGNTLRIVDPLSGELVAMGESGEITVKGPTLTPGYLKVPPEKIFDTDGFFHTGDEGYFDSEQRLIWKGRLSDIIKTGGANVSPAEIDEAIDQHPAVQGAYTVGVPDDDLGEMVVACVVLRTGEKVTEETLRQFARQTLASYKVPRRVLFYAEEELPVTGTNKVRRKELAAMAAIRLAG